MSLNFTKEACVNVAYEGYQVKRKKEHIMGGDSIKKQQDFNLSFFHGTALNPAGSSRKHNGKIKQKYSRINE